jgi:hypothetical protein
MSESIWIRQRHPIADRVPVRLRMAWAILRGRSVAYRLRLESGRWQENCAGCGCLGRTEMAVLTDHSFVVECEFISEGASAIVSHDLAEAVCADMGIDPAVPMTPGQLAEFRRRCEGTRAAAPRTAVRVPHATVKPEGMRGKVAWLLQDLAGVKGPGDRRPALADDAALYTADQVLSLIEAERMAGSGTIGQ